MIVFDWLDGLSDYAFLGVLIITAMGALLGMMWIENRELREELRDCRWRLGVRK